MSRTSTVSPSTAAGPSARGVAVVRAERSLLTILAGWAGLCLAGGGPLWLAGRRQAAAGRPGVGGLLVGVGRQALLWGAVDAAIALFGASRSKPAPEDDGEARRRARRMGLITGANALADIGYLAGGAAMTRTAKQRGDGAGILVQGLFLLLLDVQHTRRFRAIGRSEASTEISPAP